MKANGFSLVELMVVVVLASVLAMIAVPNYQNMTRVSARNQAKGDLAIIYNVERSFWAEWQSFHMCLRQLGYVYDHESPYTTGFFQREATLCGPNADKSCLIYNYATDAACNCTTGVSDCTYLSDTPSHFLTNRAVNWTTTRSKFLAGVGGNDNPDGTPDIWTMDERKLLGGDRDFESGGGSGSN